MINLSSEVKLRGNHRVGLIYLEQSKEGSKVVGGVLRAVNLNVNLLRVA